MSHGAPGPEEVVDVLRRDGTLPGRSFNLNEEAVLRRAAAIGVRVILSGAGGDHCVSFNGRGHLPHLLLSGRWRALAAEHRAQDRALWRFLARIVLRLLHPALPVMRNRWRNGLSMRRRWFIDPEFARRVKPLVLPERRLIGVRRARSYAFFRMGVWARPRASGGRAVCGAASNTAFRCWTGGCWSSPWVSRPSSSAAPGTTAG